MKTKKSIEGIEVQLVDQSAGLLGCKLVHMDAVCVLLVGLAVFLLGHLGRQSIAVGPSVLATVFCAELFLIFKMTLPVLLFIRVGDILRFRYAFAVLCAASVQVVQSSSVFWQMFSAVDRWSVCLVAGGAVVLANMLFMRYGGWLLLAGSYLVTGGLCACGPIGLIVLVLAWLARSFMTYQLGDNLEAMMAGGDIGAGYLDETRVLVRNYALVRNSRISCALMFLIGLAAAMFLRLHMMGAGLADTAAIKGLLMAELAELRGCFTVGVLVPVFITAIPLFMAVKFVRRATDILERLKGSMMLLYALVMAFSVAWSVGVVERLPPFSSLDAKSLAPDVLVAMSLLLSASVFLVEVGCRDKDVSDPVFADGFAKPSRQIRGLRVIAFTVVLLVIVAVVPFLFR